MELWCLPYAGSSASFYRKWEQSVGDAIHIRPLELPGRGVKFGEPLIRSMDALVDYAYKQVRSASATDFALFGHSLGAEIAHRLALRLEAEAEIEPKALIVSGLLPPSEPRPSTLNYNLPDEELVQELSQLGGIPPEILQYPGMWTYMLPIVRADLEAYDEGVRSGIQADTLAVRCKMTVFYGKNDPLTEGKIERWRDYAQGDFELVAFEGHHFFIHDELDDVGKAIVSALTNTRSMESAKGKR